MPAQDREKLYPIRTEVVLYYFDAEWNNAWGECQGMPAFLPLSDCPTALKSGQRVAIEGVISPARERFIWDKTRVRVLEEGVKLKGEPVEDLVKRSLDLQKHLVIVEGLIDGQTEDATHVTLSFLCGGATATVYVRKVPERTSFGFKAGDYARIKCVYSSQFDRDGNVTEISLWAAAPDDVTVIGSLDADARFTLPIAPAEAIQDGAPTNILIHVRGTVSNHEPGRWVTLWDGTGQVMVQSRQTSLLRPGTEIEAIGYPYVLGVQQCLHSGLYRLAGATNGLELDPTGISEGKPLRLAERVRELSREEAGRHLPVALRAVVTWVHPGTPFAYVQDASGGIRVTGPKWESSEAAKAGAIVVVSGETAAGQYVPVVTNAVVARAGYWNLDQAERVSLEAALTGAEEGRWVEMSGFVRQVTPEHGLVSLELSTPRGEFQVWTPASQSFDYLKGALLRVQGTCAAVANSRHQLTGIEVWAPEVKNLQVEEPAPEDVFATPLRPLGSLQRFDFQNAPNRRVRTAGTVVLQELGRYLYIQDGADSVFALTRQPEAVRPGDRVEVVGFAGNDGRKFLLREAVFRRVSAGAEPAPVQLSAAQTVNVDWEGLLAKAEGTLLDAIEKDGKARLLVRAGDSTFEAILDGASAARVQELRRLALGGRLALTGVYEVQTDEYGRPQSFLMRLLSWQDAQVLQRRPWWTLARLAWVLLGLTAVVVVAVAWGLLISRKHKLLEQAQAELRAANDQLEHRVEERTRALREQVADKERARAELAKAQEELMLASRQAGMAEVATSVLHNVGNVLNSVNVSAALLNQRLRHSRVEFVAKAAALLRQPPAQLARYLAEDAKGKTLPDYLERLGGVLTQERTYLQTELQSLVKNIEHIKIIVAMQQSNAKTNGVIEQLDPKELVEHALQTQGATYARHNIEVTRDYQPVPRVLVDRHKALQILINLISNAKYALNEKPTDKRVRLSLLTDGPERVLISVSDNGSGIARENLDRIFSQGFTTRKDGHGFGLHSGANAAKELGGSLSVHSDGVGRGATFILELPAAGAARADDRAGSKGSASLPDGLDPR
jgi:signal transduction histidine kinase